MLSDEYLKIQEQFNKVITYSQDIPEPLTTGLFERWQKSKQKFIRLFNGLIWEYPEEVCFELSQKDKNNRFDDFVDMVINRWQNEELADFVQSQRDGFFSNQVVNPYEISADVKIPKGMKLVKAFKFFESDSKLLDEIQTAASMIIQEDKVKGTLCFSVHPLDFLSISENNHNWRSCHALNGEYRSGNLSYMTDSSTCICYLKSKRDEILPNFPDDVKWNSKKWRVLLFFSISEEMLFAGRQYPFATAGGLDFIIHNALPKIGWAGWDWTEWTNQKIRAYNGIKLYSPYVPVNDALISMKNLVKNEEGSLQFNDLLFSSCYDPVYSFRTGPYGPLAGFQTQFKIGGRCNCLNCGENEIELSDSMMCNDCELKYGPADNEDVFATCPCCGNRYIYDDGVWIDGSEETLCPDCAEEYTDYCAVCGSRFYKDDLMYSRIDGAWECRYCFEPDIDEEE